MKLLIQRVKRASVSVNDRSVSAIGVGLLIFIGVFKNDGKEQAAALAKKTAALRIFEDGNGKMNLSLKDVGGSALVVSQFTLAGDTSRGNRPGFDHAAGPETAKPLYEYFSECLQAEGLNVENGIFQADMAVELINDGPVTFVLEK